MDTDLMLAFRKAEWTDAEIKKLCNNKLLARLLPFVREYDETTMAAQHIIDCDADPFVPNGFTFTIGSHQKGGQFVFDPANIKLYLSHSQLRGEVIIGNKLRKELANKHLLNANVLDFLLKNPRIIPEEWKKGANGDFRYIFFWGTIYHDARHNLCVRCLFFSNGEWGSSFGWLDDGWDENSPAAYIDFPATFSQVIT